MTGFYHTILKCPELGPPDIYLTEQVFLLRRHGAVFGVRVLYAAPGDVRLLLLRRLLWYVFIGINHARLIFSYISDARMAPLVRLYQNRRGTQSYGC